MDENKRFFSIDCNQYVFEGCVASGDHYGSANEEHRNSFEDALATDKITSDVAVGELIDAYYCFYSRRSITVFSEYLSR